MLIKIETLHGKATVTCMQICSLELELLLPPFLCHKIPINQKGQEQAAVPVPASGFNHHSASMADPH
jgi:hypothetical protein